MDEQIELLLMSYSLDQLCDDNDIDREFILRYLIEEGMVNLEDYFND